MSPPIRNQAKLAGVALAAGLAFTAFGSEDASAQARRTSLECTILGDGSVVYDFAISGVGNEDLCVVAASDFEFDCACVNNGGQCPNAAAKQTLEESASEGLNLEPRNGQITGQITVSAEAEGACDDLSCPGQTATLIQVTTDPGTLQVFEDFTTTDSTCTPEEGARAIRTARCDVQSQTQEFGDPSEDCLALFD
jgi:hypothetical protein